MSKTRFRLIWIILVNGIALFLVLRGSRPGVPRDLDNYLQRPPHVLGWQDYVRGGIPLLGVLLEVFRHRLAKYVNIGYFLLEAVLFIWAGMALWSEGLLSYYFSFGIPALFIAAVNYMLYRPEGRRRTTPSVTMR